MTDGKERSAPGQGGLNSEEVDVLSTEIEELAQDDDTTDREVILFVLRALPDSEWGQGDYDVDRLPDVGGERDV